MVRASQSCTRRYGAVQRLSRACGEEGRQRQRVGKPAGRSVEAAAAGCGGRPRCPGRPPPAPPPAQEAVVKRFLAAEPHHGERWQRAAKDPANAHLKPEVVLRKVVADLDMEV